MNGKTELKIIDYVLKAKVYKNCQWQDEVKFAIEYDETNVKKSTNVNRMICSGIEKLESARFIMEAILEKNQRDNKQI